MPGLERLRLSSKRSEASSLLAIEAAGSLELLDAPAAWWTCHDEGDLDAMVSVVIATDDEWEVRTLTLKSGELTTAALKTGALKTGALKTGALKTGALKTGALKTEAEERTDAEALARLDDTVFVFGSSFQDKSGEFDERRAFIARFSEAATLAGASTTDVLDIGSAFADLSTRALADIELLEAEDADGLINIEGAGFISNDLWLGLRWPVAADGQPVLVQLTDAADVLRSAKWSVEALLALEVSAVVVDVDASRKRPAGIRGLTVVDDALHLVVGQTERDLAEKKIKAAAARHVRVTPTGDARALATEIEQLAGFRKVEGVAPAPDGSWLYALDDEDTVVLVLSSGQAG